MFSRQRLMGALMEMLQGSFEMSRLCRVICGAGGIYSSGVSKWESHGIEDEVEPGRIWQGFRFRV